MKILILANSDMGLYKFRKELIEKLLDCGHEVYISLPAGPFIKDLQAIGCKYIETKVNRRGTNPVSDFLLYINYKSIIRNVKPNIVFTYTIKPNVYGGMACQALNIPFLANITGLGTSIENGGILQRITLSLYKRGIKGAQKIFFQNEINMKFMLDRNIVAENQCELLPGSGVNLDYFHYTSYPSEESGIRFLFIGRIMKDKGIDELFEAFQMLKQQNPSACLTLVGDFDGPYQEKVKDLTVKNIIDYVGVLEDVRPEIAKAHCVVLPSYHEGMANVLLEASAMGRPVIATNVPGCKETFDDQVSGFSCKAGDCISFFNALSLFFKLDWKEKEKMGIAANAKMKQCFNRNIIIEKYCHELKNVSHTYESLKHLK